ncbi:Ras guanine nucleotide exchange factor, putative [Entamoeba histolytica HM-1:IMSS-B]|uniref:Ras guanine nucleotide exchange factor, putative n=6 Tax=Entamoeba histolytica TaxID=5759 RepID=C4LWX9_ENTH1|nr:Ras guanine nucleotide exchange factor, putative [Entamoeba histolytica HM-1:IMSS]EMD48660.1 ras guanine nucleotide exchange factor slime mold, putative [Entamoeba histolytica KU27]EMH72684.1 Ras guanine nucleotide exchange factor, putative [Entamoeba histolytica HM-1:IMSS-B]EMS13916.1 ras guanine nucleotide exchange factor, slime mold, putative [Entamoeba histolytica HM-3:IMSS]ENY64662.1 ras guanine nucleotide exchange factor, slime mold, putative [Entamoeba histolytica HM-1:IMSS-A]GAT9322|eukprot:XP_651554.1 Ras guanine nucleotide exchange factor, putative [Entamoeba histolytica HM-1:IMSS]
MSISASLVKEQEELKKRVDELTKQISSIKKEANEGIDFDKRMMDLLEMKQYLGTIKDNSELKKIYITSTRTKKEKKGNYKMTLRRQKALTLKTNDNEPMYNVIEIRKQFAIDSVAREIEKMARDQVIDDPSFTNSVDKLIQSLAEQLDTDCKTNDVNDLLKTFDVNSVALRKTSTMFKVTSRLFSMEPIVEEETIADDAEYERIALCEKLTFTDIIKKVADFSVSMEDAICLSAVMLGKPHDDYSGDFFDVCSQTIVNITELSTNIIALFERLSKLRGDEEVRKSYEVELKAYIDIVEEIIEREKENTVKRLLSNNEKVDEVKVEFRPGDLEEIIRETALKVKTSISHALMSAYAMAHMKPKEYGKLKEENGEKKKKKDEKKREFVLDRCFYKEKMALVELMSLVLNVYHVIEIFSEQTREIVCIKQSETEIGESHDKADIQLIKNHVTSGNVNGFIERLTTTEDKDFAELIVSSFGSFMTSKEFIRKLVEAHRTGDKAVKKNVMKVFSLIIYKTFADLGKDAESILIGYLENMTEPEAVEMRVQCKRKANIKDLNIAGLLIPPINFYIPDEPIFPTEFFISCEPKEIARQLTMIDYGMYKKVKQSELLENLPSVMKRNKICRYSHVIEMVNRIDEIANWTATTILMFADMNNRVAMMMKFIEVANELESLNNYHSLAGICKGFELETVQRLGITVKNVGSHLKHLTDISKNLGFNSGSFKGYKSAVEKVKDACVPFILPTIKDIHGVYEKQPSSGKIINTIQKEQILELASKFLKYQNYEYGFTITDPLYTYLFDLCYLPVIGNPGEDSYQRKISLLCVDAPQ